MSVLLKTRLLVSRSCFRPSRTISRAVSTLQNNYNTQIYVFSDKQSHSTSHILSLLPTDPPTPDLALGTTTTLPPTPSTFTENPKFLPILQEVLKEYACKDPGVLAQAQAFASQAGSALGSGGMFFPRQQGMKRGDDYGFGNKRSGDGAGGASSQGGAGGGGRGGHVHLSDRRAPPDYGRIAWPEDIFGSVEVDGRGEIVEENGNYQESGSYRICTRDGILGLSEFLNARVVERLADMEKSQRNK